MEQKFPKFTEVWIGLNLKVQSLTCLAGAVVASWSPTQEVAVWQVRAILL